MSENQQAQNIRECERLSPCPSLRRLLERPNYTSSGSLASLSSVAKRPTPETRLDDLICIATSARAYKDRLLQTIMRASQPQYP